MAKEIGGMHIQINSTHLNEIRTIELKEREVGFVVHLLGVFIMSITSAKEKFFPYVP